MKFELKKLAEPFPEKEIEWRVGQCGTKGNGQVWAKVLAYVQARAIMNRLDDVVGPENWRASYKFEDANGVICNGVICLLSIKCDNEWVTKEDGAEQTDIEAFKGGISSALKRAGSAWGVGRYLYGLESTWATICDETVKGSYWAKTKEGKSFNWLPPTLPAWALPKGAPSNHVPPVVLEQPPLGVGIQPMGYTFPYGMLAKMTPDKPTTLQLIEYVEWLEEKKRASTKPSVWGDLALEKATAELDKRKVYG